MTFEPQHLIDDLRGTFRGRLALDSLTRTLYSTDASPFEVMPLGVAFPEDAADLSTLVRYCHDHAIPMTPRGAGTGVAGESLGPGLTIDLSVHFRRISDITNETVTVEPGVVLAELNRELVRHGRRFAPDPASRASCTLGGMIATNASGGNCFRFGYTRDYVDALDVVWDTGDADSLNRRANDEGRRTTEIRDAVSALLETNRDLIRATSVRTPFNRCGYRFDNILTPRGPDLAKLMVGSEGTLGFVTRATLRTVPLPGGTCVALLGFPSLEAAVRAGLDLRRFAPVSCDLLDRRLLSLSKNSGAGQMPPMVGAALLVTFEGDTERESRERTWGAVETLRASHVMLTLAEPTCDPDGIGRIRGIREAAVGGLYALGKGPRPLAFVEDVGVPAEALPEFLTKTQDILQCFELTGSFLVHALTAQVHTRPLIDLDSPTDREKLWPVAEAVHSLALSLGGTVSTQHGTGIARTPWVERQAGPLMPVFRELKRIFDPKDLLNPGKIVGPDPTRPAWPLRTDTFSRDAEFAERSAEPAERTPLLVWSNTSPQAEASRCTGCGDCRPRGTHARMCPVFHATGTEAATPRAKANLLRTITERAELGTDDVRAVADLCVNCKMCRDECPARVDVPKLMLETKAAHQAERGLDRDDWVLARTESLAVLGSHFAPFVNGMLGVRSFRWMMEKLLGISRRRRLPAFALRNFFRTARGRGLTKKRDSSLRIPKSAFRNQKVAYFVDIFAAYNDSLIAEATVAVLKHNGIEVFVPPRQVGCGMAPLAVGDAETARELAVRNIRLFADLVREGYRVVCSEPTAALMLSQDYLDILNDPDAVALAANTVELTTFLHELHAAGRLDTRFRPLDLTLGHHVPCHLKALRGPAAGPSLLSLIPGLRVHTIDVSCSGMAGTWGLKAKNHANSLAAGAPMLAELNRPGVLFGSTECSACRMQMQEGTGKRTLHPVQYLAYAYGLMPEIGAKLRKPLGELVSE